MAEIKDYMIYRDTETGGLCVRNSNHDWIALTHTSSFIPQLDLDNPICDIREVGGSLQRKLDGKEQAPSSSRESDLLNEIRALSEALTVEQLKSSRLEAELAISSPVYGRTITVTSSSGSIKHYKGVLKS